MICALPAALFAAAALSAPAYSSREQALARAFPPPASIERKTYFLSDAEREKASKLARSKVESSLVVAYLGRENFFPDGAFLLTGTGIVPPDSFTLQAGDVVRIEVPGIGTLCNPVVQGDEA